jgi:hypothetical protein
MSDAINLKLTQKVDKSSLRFITEQAWQIPEDYLGMYCLYTLLYWQGEYLESVISDGYIEHFGRKFKVLFLHCTPETAFKSVQVRLSFRVPLPETGLVPTVLINIWR